MIANPSTFDFSKFTPAQLELMQGTAYNSNPTSVPSNLASQSMSGAPTSNVANLAKPANQRVYDPNLPISATNMPLEDMPLFSDHAFVPDAPKTNALPPPMVQAPAPTSSNIDPAIQPYLGYGLSEAQRLYQAGGPQYYGGQTYVSPSTTTQTGLQALEARAKLGNPLLQSAQNQLQGTVSGDYLGGNPFFQGAFAPAARAAQGKFSETLSDIGSKASLAGRYGSSAMGTLQDRAAGIFGQSLADTAGNLAYKNYSDERARQEAATLAAPEMAGADYQDIQNLLKAGQTRETYTGAQQKSDIEKFNFLQNQPQENLQAYLNSIYGNPINKAQQPASDTGASGLQNLLGTAATLAGIEDKTNWLSKGWKALTGP